MGAAFAVADVEHADAAAHQAGNTPSGSFAVAGIQIGYRVPHLPTSNS